MTATNSSSKAATGELKQIREPLHNYRTNPDWASIASNIAQPVYKTANYVDYFLQHLVIIYINGTYLNGYCHDNKYWGEQGPS